MEMFLCIYLQHKYQINIDGTVAAYRFPYLLAGNSLVLKQDSPYYEYFYKDLKPFEHYIPIKRDLSDIMEKIQWAKDNEEKVLYDKSLIVKVNNCFQNLRLPNHLRLPVHQS